MESNLTYGEALVALKEGKLASRAGWNGKGMFIFIRPEAIVPVSFVKFLPDFVKDYFAKIEVEDVTFSAYLCMKAADESIVNGWLASQTDMLANDWGIL
jgi:hypothetical protein